MANSLVASFARTHFPFNTLRVILQLPDDFNKAITPRLRNADKILDTKVVEITDYPDLSPKSKLITVAPQYLADQKEGNKLSLDFVIDGEVPLIGEYTFSYKIATPGSASSLDPIPLTINDGTTVIPVTILGSNGGGTIDPSQVSAAIALILGEKQKPFVFTSANGSYLAEMQHNFGTKLVDCVAFDANGVRDELVKIKAKAGATGVNISLLDFPSDDPKYAGGKFVGTVILTKLS